MSGELSGGGGDPVAVGVGGGPADVLALVEGLGVLGEDLQAVEPVLEGRIRRGSRIRRSLMVESSIGSVRMLSHCGPMK